MEKFKINLDRNLPLQLKDSSGEKIIYNHDHYYRMIGKTGYKDLITNGIIGSNHLKKESKQYKNIFFNKGYPLSRYSNHRDDIDYFIELKPTENIKIIDEKEQYPKIKYYL